MQLNRMIFGSIIVGIMLISAFFMIKKRDGTVTVDIAQQLYVYAYPRVMVEEIQRAAFQNLLPSASTINQFMHVAEFPTAEFKYIVRPNVDTLYSVAWLDLSEEPLVLSVPDTQGRYYVIPLLDAWTNVFASLGKRTTGAQAQNFLIAGPGWHGDVPEGMNRIDAPTNTVWVLGRTQTNGPDDYNFVHTIQQGYRLTPLHRWHEGMISNAQKPQSTIPGTQRDSAQAVAAMNADHFYSIFIRSLKKNPPLPDDGAMITVMQQFGIQDPYDSVLPTETIDRLNRNIDSAQHVIARYAHTLGDMINGWRVVRSDIGTYGRDYMRRAAVALIGIGANLPEDAIYPTAFVDAQGAPLHGNNSYSIHFDADKMPPVNAFWSVTLYDQASYLVANTLNRYALGDRDALAFNEDGSLDLYISHAMPSNDKQANWLPAPAGSFNLTMRLYWPKEEVLNGTWNPPAIMRVP